MANVPRRCATWLNRNLKGCYGKQPKSGFTARLRKYAPAPGKPAPLLIPKGKFVPEQILELLDGERSRLLKLTEFLEQGKDYDWCAAEWTAEVR